ncbi:ferritin-like fold-containing protein [Nocardioides nematodiphilus]|uniref:ferritin-like fold-containing protein n=1 Tax=Nocardioides nematodiphilus TaxID=2849669 RepID=UPI001CDA1F20|nr:ferritin-like fold-containing protein [Nocardioides nematodiphilus]MCA1984561.1 ferritin-like domain-containing protein [Nocardioides nematodiphilus]
MVASVAPDLTDPRYRAAIIDLLGAIAYGEISAAERLSEDAGRAPSLGDKVELLQLAHAQFKKVDPIMDALRALGADPDEAMAPFQIPIDAFHAYTAPADWWESLVKAYVGDNLVRDFYREFAVHLDAKTRGIIESTLVEDRSEFVVDRVRAGIEADHLIAGRLALWGRRIMGEALTQTQHVAAERESLSDVLAGDVIGTLDLASIAEMFGRITQHHIERMGKLGLEH